MNHQRALGALIVAVAAVSTACGSSDTGSNSAGSNTDATRTIEVAMLDNSFAPAKFTVEAGQTVTFRFRNKGAVLHEAIIGTAAEQDDHEAQMTEQQDGMDGSDDMDGMGHDGSKSSGMDGATTVEPGATGTMTKRFTKSGTIILGCHQPGHYVSGMKSTITIS